MADVIDVVVLGNATKITRNNGNITYYFTNGRILVSGEDITIILAALSKMDGAAVIKAKWGQITNKYGTIDGESLVDYWLTNTFFPRF